MSEKGFGHLVKKDRDIQWYMSVVIAHYYIIFVAVEPMEDAVEKEIGCQTVPMLISCGTSTTAKIVVGMETQTQKQKGVTIGNTYYLNSTTCTKSNTVLQAFITTHGVLMQSLLYLLLFIKLSQLNFV